MNSFMNNLEGHIGFIKCRLKIKRYIINVNNINRVVIWKLPIKSTFIIKLITKEIIERYLSVNIIFSIQRLKWHEGWFNKVRERNE